MLTKKGLGRLASAILLTSSFAASSSAPEGQYQERATELIEASAGTLQELAEELFLDFLCLQDANPHREFLERGEFIPIPLACCKYSCQGPLCCKRDECNGQTTSSAALPSHTSTASVVITNTYGTGSVVVTTISISTTTSHYSAHSSTDSCTTSANGHTTSVVPPHSSSPHVPTYSSSSQASGSSSGSTPGSSSTSPSHSSIARSSATGNSGSASHSASSSSHAASNSNSASGSSSSSTSGQGRSSTVSGTGSSAKSSGSTLSGTMVSASPSNSGASASSSIITTTNASGKPVTLTLSSGSSITGPTTLTTSGVTLTLGSSSNTHNSASNVETLTEPDGSSIILTLPSSGSSITGLQTITTDGSTLTIGPAPTSASPSSSLASRIIIGGSTFLLPSSSETITAVGGSTVVIGPSGIIESTNTIPFPSGPTTITTDGVTLTFGGSASGTGTTTGLTSTGPTVGSASSATRSPAITPPPAGSPGAIPSDVPASGPPQSEIAITFNGDTYVLPHTVSVELLQTDGSTVTLFSDSVVSGSATVSVPPSSSQTSLSSGGLSLDAGPKLRGSSATGGLTGFAALINALEGLAGSANSIVNTLDQIGHQGALCAAGSLSDSAFSSGVGALFDSATSDLDNFVSTMSATFDDFNSEVYELTEDGERRIFPARTGGVEALNLLKSLRKLTRGITGLRNDVVVKVKEYWKQGTAAAAALAAAEEALRNFGSYDWRGEKPQKSSTASTSINSTATATLSRSRTSSSSSSTATATQYMFTTKSDTDLSTFQSYIKTLPDGGDGYQIVFPNVPWQRYVTNLTVDQAKDVASQIFVDFVILITGLNDTAFEPIPSPRRIQARVAGNQNLDERPDSNQNLRVISVNNQQERSEITGAALPNYIFDPVLGKGQTIYVLEAGFNTAHSEFSTASGRTVDTQVVPNELTLAKATNRDYWAPPDITDYTGHGTAVASLAAGVIYGVASRANLVLVKFKQAAQNPLKPFNEDGTKNYKPLQATESAVGWAWDWIIDDVAERRKDSQNPGKFIINMSGGFEVEAKMTELMTRVLQKCWDNDIITVVAAGNEGDLGKSLNQFTPSNIGTSRNGLITVGGVDNNGVLASLTTIDAGNGGSLSVYAPSKNVFAADYTKNSGGKADKSGTSLAAPAVAGLAAYFASLESLAGKWKQGQVATAMKEYIIKYAYVRSANPIPGDLDSSYRPIPAADSIKVAYNRAFDGLCSAEAPAKRALDMGRRPNMTKRHDPSGDFPVVVSGTVVVASLSQSYCTVESKTSSSSATLSSSSRSSIRSSSSRSTTTPPPTSGSFVRTLTNLPTLSSASYCTEILSNGREILHTKTGSCTYNTAEPTTSTAAPAPTINVDKGILTCGTRTDQGNAAHWFSLGDAYHAQNNFCGNMTKNETPIIFQPGRTTYKIGTYIPPDNQMVSITMSAKWGVLDDSGCPTLNMSQNTAATFALCLDRLNQDIYGCDQQSNGWEEWKQGGRFFRDCITWEMTGVPT